MIDINILKRNPFKVLDKSKDMIKKKLNRSDYDSETIFDGDVTLEDMTETELIGVASGIIQKKWEEVRSYNSSLESIGKQIDRHSDDCMKNLLRDKESDMRSSKSALQNKITTFEENILDTRDKEKLIGYILDKEYWR